MTKEQLANKYDLCNCGEEYKSRRLTAPDCPWHAWPIEEAMDEWASLRCQSLVDALLEIKETIIDTNYFNDPGRFIREFDIKIRAILSQYNEGSMNMMTFERGHGVQKRIHRVVYIAKEHRQEIFNKYGGKCAYCGCDLVTGWHADHIKPLNRDHTYNKETRKYVATGECRNPENDTVENLSPSCASCNITKSGMDIEDFRAYIQQTVESLNKNQYRAYRFAKRYGLIQETIKPVVFYFEAYQQSKKQP